MSELPFEDERVQDNLKLLMRYMQQFIGEPLNSSTVSTIKTTLDEHRRRFKAAHGYEFPPLVPLILPRSQFVAWFRADLDNDEIRIKVLNLLHEFHVKKVPVSEMELAAAIRLAWPNYEPPIEFYRNAKQVTLH